MDGNKNEKNSSEMPKAGPIIGPSFRNFSSLGLDEAELSCVQHSPWEIHVWPLDDLYKALFLGYILPLIELDAVDLIKELRMMVNNADLDYTRLVNDLKHNNPFLDKCVCFSDESIQQFLLIFQEQLIDVMIRNKNHRTSQINSTENCTVINRLDIVEAASILLDCYILILRVANESEQSQGANLRIPCFPEIKMDEYSGKKLVLYVTLYPDCKIFSFGITDKIASHFQTLALADILDKPVCEIKSQLPLPEARSDIVTKILGMSSLERLKELKDIWPDLIWKLHFACFETNPAEAPDVTEREKTCFYYAASTDDFVFLVTLYNQCFTYNRNSNIERLQNIKNISALLNNTLKSFLPVQNKKIYNQVRKLSETHKFVQELTKKTSVLTNNYSGMANIIVEACQYRDFLLILLTTYNKHFDLQTNQNNNGEIPSHGATNEGNELFKDHNNERDPGIRNDEDDIKNYENFKIFSGFYTLIDFQTIFAFFRKSHHLKERLKLESGAYDKIESALARYLLVKNLYYSFFGIINEQDKSKDQAKGRNKKNIVKTKTEKLTSLNQDNFNEIFVSCIYWERKRLKDAVEKFIFTLREITPDESNTIKILPANEIHTLQTDLILRDGFFPLRLRHYISLVMSLDLDNNMDSGIFIIERCLHIIGELITLEIEESPSLVKSLLASSLPQGIADILKKIRNKFSHINIKSLTSREAVEKDKTFYKNLQDELSTIEKNFRHIEELQEYLLLESSLRNAVSALDTLLQSNSKSQTSSFEYSNTSTDLNTSDLSTKSLDRKHESIASKERGTHLKLQQDKLYDHLEQIRNEIIQFTTNMRDKIRIHLKRHMLWIQGNNKAASDISDEKEKEKAIRRIENRFKAVTVILKFVNKWKFEGNIKEDDGKLFEILKTHEDNFKFENIDEIISQYKEIMQTIIGCSMDYEKKEEEDSYTNIQLFMRIVCGHSYITEEVKEDIKSHVPINFREQHEAKEKLLHSLEQDVDLPEDDLLSAIEKLCERKKRKKMIEHYKNKKIDVIRNCSDPFGELLNSLEKNEIPPCTFVRLSKKFMFDERVKAELDVLVINRPVQNRALEFLQQRIITMGELLSKPDPRFYNQQKKYGKVLSNSNTLLVEDIQAIGTGYYQNTSLQAAVEQLVFDCISVLKEHNSNIMWKKANYLFNGFNMRNLVAHGNPLIEYTGSVLCPGDCASEVLSKALELIRDLPTIKALVILRSNISDGFEDVTEFINSEQPDDTDNLKQQIKQCKNWKIYARLIPRKEKEE